MLFSLSLGVRIKSFYTCCKSSLARSRDCCRIGIPEKILNQLCIFQLSSAQKNSCFKARAETVDRNRATQSPLAQRKTGAKGEGQHLPCDRYCGKIGVPEFLESSNGRKSRQPRPVFLLWIPQSHPVETIWEKAQDPIRRRVRTESPLEIKGTSRSPPAASQQMLQASERQSSLLRHYRLPVSPSVLISPVTLLDNTQTNRRHTDTPHRCLDTRVYGTAVLATTTAQV